MLVFSSSLLLPSVLLSPHHHCEEEYLVLLELDLEEVNSGQTSPVSPEVLSPTLLPLPYLHWEDSPLLSPSMESLVEVALSWHWVVAVLSVVEALPSSVASPSWAVAVLPLAVPLVVLLVVPSA